MKVLLVSALSACAAERCKAAAVQFLQGLSADELQYIADFFGACILESAAGVDRGPTQLARGFADSERCRHPAPSCDGLNDQEHKMVLLFEYLCRCGLNRVPVAVRAAGHAG
jgi:hypothetical protein